VTVAELIKTPSVYLIKEPIMATDTHSSTAQTADTFNLPVGHRISWGAIFAGVSLLFALSWLLLVLGTAIGVGIADATDLGAIGDGLGIGAIIWILLSTILATFAGGLLAAKLAGTVDDRIGALHGLTVWSVGMLLIIVMAASGIGGAVNAISGAVGSASKMSSSVMASATSEDGGMMLPDSITTSIAAVLKRQASSIISDTASGQNSPNQGEVRSAIESLNAEDTGAIVSALIAGDTEQAREELSDRTNMSNSEINSIIRGAEQQADDWTDDNDVQQAQQWLTSQMNNLQRSVSQSVSDLAGASVSSREINRAIDQLDSDTLMEAGRLLIMGKPEMAKDALAVNTTLSEDDIEAVVNGAEREVEQLINEAKEEFNEATEAVGTYTQAILWSAFIAAALGLLAGLIGGHMGAGTVRRIYATR
jgi:hypothetical protein